MKNSAHSHTAVPQGSQHGPGKQRAKMVSHPDSWDSREGATQRLGGKGGGPFGPLALQDGGHLEEDTSFESEQVCLCALQYSFRTFQSPHLLCCFLDLRAYNSPLTPLCPPTSLWFLGPAWHTPPPSSAPLFSVWDPVNVYVTPSLLFLWSSIKCHLRSEPP